MKNEFKKMHFTGMSAPRSKRTLTAALHFVPETDVHADIAAVKATKFAKQDLLKAT
ncbi:hypothetical protein RVX72_002538 [Citrobacter freundii]|nr:hypothetical protein [Citrobacter freundii]